MVLCRLSHGKLWRKVALCCIRMYVWTWAHCVERQLEVLHNAFWPTSGICHSWRTRMRDEWRKRCETKLVWRNSSGFWGKVTNNYCFTKTSVWINIDSFWLDFIVVHGNTILPNYSFSMIALEREKNMPSAENVQNCVAIVSCSARWTSKHKACNH